jgi:hypothetical protein
MFICLLKVMKLNASVLSNKQQQHMRCVFCDNVFDKRKTGDHIIPQGLGRFHPNKTVCCICKDCDAKNGNDFERIALRTGLIGFFRSIKGIKSNNNKKSPQHSLSLDKFGALESQQFSVTNISNPEESVYLDGPIMAVNKIIVRKMECKFILLIYLSREILGIFVISSKLSC